MAKLDFHSFNLFERHHKPFIDFSKRRNKEKKMYQLNIKPGHPISITNLGIGPARLSMGSAVINIKKENKENAPNIHMLEGS